MAIDFKVGDHVESNSEAGRVCEINVSENAKK